MSTLLLVVLAFTGCETTAPEYADEALFSISLAPVTLAVGETVQLTDPSTKKTNWRSSDSNVATVTSTGLVTGMAGGRALIEARSAGTRWVTEVTVESLSTGSGSVVSVSVTPSSASVAPGGTVQLAATARDANGNTVTGVTFTWSSTNTAVATVSSSGVVTGVSGGSAEVRATTSGETGSASVTVTAGATPSAAGIWMSAAELAALPTSGASWDNVKRAADSDLRGGVLTVRDDHNTRVMAAALVAARLNSDQYRGRVRDALRALMAAPYGSDDGLAANRRLGTYAIAADLIGLAAFDPQTDAAFRSWLATARDTYYSSGGGGTIPGYHERRPNNYGTHAGASRMAVALYLGDRTDFERAVTVFRGYLGNRSAYAGFQFRDDFSWHADPDRPVGINPRGATKSDGTALRNIDGVIPDDQRRCGSFQWPPCKTNYAWEALQGAMAMAWIAHRQGLDAFNWSDRALLRAVVWLYDQAGYPAGGDDVWQMHIVNRVYGTSYAAANTTQPGKNIGWTEWTHR
jgi:hypothetical protein